LRAHGLTGTLWVAQVRAMLDDLVPKAKAHAYALGLSLLFTLEVGPLLTALLLCGRVGGSYAGEVATLQATHQVSRQGVCALQGRSTAV